MEPKRKPKNLERPPADQPDVIEPPGPVKKKSDVIAPERDKRKVPDPRELK